MMAMIMEMKNIFNLLSGKPEMGREESGDDEADKGKYMHAPAMLLKRKLLNMRFALNCFTLEIETILPELNLHFTTPEIIPETTVQPSINERNWTCDGRTITLYEKVTRAECRLAKLVTRYEKKTGDKDRFSSISFSDAIKNETNCQYLFWYRKVCK
jgi:hypothetical protein